MELSKWQVFITVLYSGKEFSYSQMAHCSPSPLADKASPSHWLPPDISLLLGVLNEVLYGFLIIKDILSKEFDYGILEDL